MATKLTEEAAAVLHRLVETCRCAQSGYETAAKGVKNRDVKQRLESYARLREQFASELQAEVEHRGGSAREDLLTTLQRGWASVKVLFASLDERGILEQCARAEGEAVEAYEEALRCDLPPELRTLLTAQRTHVREAQQRLRALLTVAAAARV